MTPELWVTLVMSVIGLMGALTAYLKGQTAHNAARRAASNASVAKMVATNANFTANQTREALKQHTTVETTMPPEDPTPPAPGNVYTLPAESDKPDIA